MKRTSTLVALFCLIQSLAFGQNKYVMVIEKADGTETVINVEDIVRTYFRESGVSYTTCPDGNHPHMIDLGLPKGTKWACCNVGANAPEEFGDYFAWGETQPKEVYDWSTYIHCDGSEDTCHNIGSDISGNKDYDAATANWGSPWKMPTDEHFIELIDNCTPEWTQENGIYGWKFTGSNGGNIFLPAAGARWDDKIDHPGEHGFYWSSTLEESGQRYALKLFFDSWSANWDEFGLSRHYGFTVRPVR